MEHKNIPVFCEKVSASTKDALNFKSPVAVELIISRAVQSKRRKHLDHLMYCILSYLKAKDKKMRGRTLGRLYRAISDDLTAFGIWADYYPTEQHKVQSGRYSVAIMGNTLYVFRDRRAYVAFDMSFYGIVAYILPSAMRDFID